jgi:hypothetical protein
MSSLFEKAIADAKELKETALKNAEQLIIEKYSTELKEAVENLLEQEDEEEEAAAAWQMEVEILWVKSRPQHLVMKPFGPSSRRCNSSTAQALEDDEEESLLILMN